MNKIINKNIVFLSILYFFTTFSVDHFTPNCQDCICHRYEVVKYALELKEDISNKINGIPKSAKKIVANGVVKVEGFYDTTKNIINDGVIYLKDIFISIVNWAHDVKDSE